MLSKNVLTMDNMGSALIGSQLLFAIQKYIKKNMVYSRYVMQNFSENPLELPQV